VRGKTVDSAYCKKVKFNTHDGGCSDVGHVEAQIWRDLLMFKLVEFSAL
jgi:hypothetical protein